VSFVLSSPAGSVFDELVRRANQPCLKQRAPRLQAQEEAEKRPVGHFSVLDFGGSLDRWEAAPPVVGSGE